jgi:hypothetical protein
MIFTFSASGQKGGIDCAKAKIAMEINNHKTTAFRNPSGGRSIVSILLSVKFATIPT